MLICVGCSDVRGEKQTFVNAMVVYNGASLCGGCWAEARRNEDKGREYWAPITMIDHLRRQKEAVLKVPQ